jgi:hypothetical protein
LDNECQRSAAIEEMKLLSSIIGRIENSIYKQKGWLLTLVTGLSLALLKDEPFISKQQYLFISILITILFLIVDGIQRVPVHRAILRSRDVETSLRENKNFDSPLISASLRKGNDIKDAFEMIRGIRVYFTYLAVILFILIIYCFAP